MRFAYNSRWAAQLSGAHEEGPSIARDTVLWHGGCGRLAGGAHTHTHAHTYACACDGRTWRWSALFSALAARGTSTSSTSSSSPSTSPLPAPPRALILSCQPQRGSQVDSLPSPHWRNDANRADCLGCKCACVPMSLRAATSPTKVSNCGPNTHKRTAQPHDAPSGLLRTNTVSLKSPKCVEGAAPPARPAAPPAAASLPPLTPRDPGIQGPTTNGRGEGANL
jgi:hypothetical protein